MDFDFEKSLIPEELHVVCGVDEAGRGPLAGPVFAGAVILPDAFLLEGLNDSKKLSEKKRDRLFDEITKNALAWSFGTASPEEIDEINILNASLLAMRRAVEGLKIKPDFLLIDGNIARGFQTRAKSVIKGDALCPSIAAASIIAKVLRDRFCLEMHEKFPQYGFDRHKGYPTKLHYERIREYGISPLHRKSFLKKLNSEK